MGDARALMTGKDQQPKTNNSSSRRPKPDIFQRLIPAIPGKTANGQQNPAPLMPEKGLRVITRFFGKKKTHDSSYHRGQRSKKQQTIIGTPQDDLQHKKDQ